MNRTALRLLVISRYTIESESRKTFRILGGFCILGITSGLRQLVMPLLVML